MTSNSNVLVITPAFCSFAKTCSAFVLVKQIHLDYAECVEFQKYSVSQFKIRRRFELDTIFYVNIYPVYFSYYNYLLRYKFIYIG